MIGIHQAEADQTALQLAAAMTPRIRLSSLNSVTVRPIQFIQHPDIM